MLTAVGVRPRILVVDDDPSVLSTYAMILQQQGYEAVAVGTLAEGRRALGEGPYQLVICDLSVGHPRGGFELIAYARDLDPATPAILLTGFADRDAVWEAEHKQITLIFKPVDVRELLKTIEGLANRGAA